MVPELIPVLGSQPAADQSQKPSGRLPLLSARPVVTSPAAEHHRPLADTKLYCLLTEAHVCTQIVQGCTQQRGGRDSNQHPVDRKSGSLTTRLTEPHPQTVTLTNLPALRQMVLECTRERRFGSQGPGPTHSWICRQFLQLQATLVWSLPS